MSMPTRLPGKGRKCFQVVSDSGWRWGAPSSASQSLPELILDRRSDTAADNVVRGTVVLIELMGNELIVHVDVAGQTVIGRLEAHAPVAYGAEHDFMLDMRYSHFFDPDSGNNVSQS
jgi:ABC-type sugar transport system ATPase subunit